jgi:hypothetical protein
MQLQLINGIYTDSTADFRTSYPINMTPVPKQSGISEGYLRTTYGLTKFATGFGIDRGGIRWNDVLYRVSGNWLISIDQNGDVTQIGQVAGNLQCTMEYSLTDLVICTQGYAYIWSPTRPFTQITDPNLGNVFDVVWIDGYFIYTDGNYLVQSELTDPTKFDPNAYGSSIADPDPIRGVTKLRNELYAINRYSTEIFQDVGVNSATGQGFAFQRIPGALINVGCVGPRSKCKIGDGFCVVGGARTDSTSVWYIEGSQAVKVATREIEIILAEYTEQQIKDHCNTDNLTYYIHEFLIIYLPNHTLVWDQAASQAMKTPVWHIWSTSTDGNGPFRGQNAVYIYNKWIFGDSIDGTIGYWDETVNTHYGQAVGWRIDTQFVYNESKGFIINWAELVGLSGRYPDYNGQTISMSKTKDGLNWSDEKFISIGKAGDYTKRLRWRRLGIARNYMGLRFKGCSNYPITFARLEVDIKACNG